MAHGVVKLIYHKGVKMAHRLVKLDYTCYLVLVINKWMEMAEIVVKVVNWMKVANSLVQFADSLLLKFADSLV